MTAWNFPLQVLLDDGSRVPVYPSRAVAAVSNGPDWTTAWYFDPDGLIDSVHINAEVEHVRAALGLDGLDDDAEA